MLPGAASWPAWPPRGCSGHRHRADSSHRWAGFGCQTWQGTRPVSWPGPIFHQHPPRALGPATPRCAAGSRSLRCHRCSPQAATAPWQGETQPAPHRPPGTSCPAGQDTPSVPRTQPWGQGEAAPSRHPPGTPAPLCLGWYGPCTARGAGGTRGSLQSTWALGRAGQARDTRHGDTSHGDISHGDALHEHTCCRDARRRASSHGRFFLSHPLPLQDVLSPAPPGTRGQPGRPAQHPEVGMGWLGRPRFLQPYCCTTGTTTSLGTSPGGATSPSPPAGCEPLWVCAEPCCDPMGNGGDVDRAPGTGQEVPVAAAMLVAGNIRVSPPSLQRCSPWRGDGAEGRVGRMGQGQGQGGPRLGAPRPRADPC